MLTPNCGYEPEYQKVAVARDLPEGINLGDYVLVDFDIKAITVQKTMNFAIKDKTISIDITYTPSGMESFKMSF